MSRFLAGLVTCVAMLGFSTPAQAATPSQERHYVQAVYQRIPVLQGHYKDVVQIGNRECQLLRSGYTEQSLLVKSHSHGFVHRTIAVTVAQAHRFLCPGA